MDEDYLVVSKGKITKLEKENFSLKKEVQKVPKAASKIEKENTEFISQIIKAIQDESKKERELVNKNLNEIKELNKTTLDNVLHRTEKLDNKTQILIDTITELTSSVSQLLGEMPQSKIQTLNISEELLKEISDKLDIKSNELELDIISDKLREIHEFMNNLKILLGQIKPSDMKK